MDIRIYLLAEHRALFNLTSLKFEYRHSISLTWGFGLRPPNTYWYHFGNLLLGISKFSNSISVAQFKGIASSLPPITTTRLSLSLKGLSKVGHLKLSQPFKFKYVKLHSHQICANGALT